MTQMQRLWRLRIDSGLLERSERRRLRGVAEFCGFESYSSSQQ